VDPQFTKAYHRRALGYLGLEKFELAVNDLLKILESSKDEEIQALLTETKKKLENKNKELEQPKINDAEDGPAKMTKNSLVLTAADYEHKEAQRSHFALIEAKITDLKERAVLSASQNNYQKAKALYQ